MGLDATSIDVAAAAIAIAERKALAQGLTARFLVHDALALATLREAFETVLDCGLFHIFEDDDRPRFVDSLRAVIPAGGRYYMLCFSDLQPGDWGPRRVTKPEITANFSHGWRIDAIEPAKVRHHYRPQWCTRVARDHHTNLIAHSRPSTARRAVLARRLTPFVFLHVGHEIRPVARDACQRGGLQAGRRIACSGHQVELVPLLTHVVAHVTDDLPQHAADVFGLVECQVNGEVFALDGDTEPLLHRVGKPLVLAL
jgi:hypothetical protein